MSDREIFQQFVKNHDFTDESIDEIKETLSLSDKRLIRDTFSLLNEEIKYLDETQDYIYIINNCIDLLSIICINKRFTEEEVVVNRKRIKKSREKLLQFYHTLKNNDLLILANKLDEIVLDKGVDLEDLKLLIKTLIKRNEDFNIVKKLLNINKGVLLEDTNELFDYTFNLAMDAIKNNDYNIYYYIALLKIFYSTKIDKTKYIFRILKETSEENEFANEIYYIIHGNKRAYTTEEILNKYGVLTEFDTVNIYVPKIETYDDFVVTIDTKNAELRDDGLSIRKDGSSYLLGIHISDTASLVDLDSIVDLQARNNLSCTYMPTARTRIFPQDIEQALSLDKGQYRKVFTLNVVIDSNGIIQDYYLTQNIIKTTENYTFEECDNILNSNNVDSISKKIKELAEVTSLLEMNNPKKLIYWQKKNNDSIDKRVETYNSSKIVSESMVLYNYLKGCIARDEGYPYTFRTQNESDIDNIIDELNIKMDEDTRKVIKNIYLKSIYTDKPLPHHGLGLPLYSHSSSGGRRYIDSYNQQLDHIFKFKDKKYDYNPEIHKQMIDYFNQRKIELALMASEYTRAAKMERKLELKRKL